MADAKKEEVPVSSIGPTNSRVQDVNAKGSFFQPPKAKEEPLAAVTPSGAKSGEKPPVEDPNKDVPFHEHPRWKEVQSERKELRATVETLKQQLAQISAKPAPTTADVSKAKNLVARLVQTSTMDEANAQAFVDELLSEVESRTKKEISPLQEDYQIRVETQTRIRKADDNWTKFKGEASELSPETEKKMVSIYKKLSPEEQNQVSQDSTLFGLKMLMKLAEGEKDPGNLPETPPAAISAPKTGSVAGKGTGTASTGFKFKMSEINAMPNALFKQKYAEIQAAKAAGQIDVNS